MTSCANPLPFETLVALWTDELAGDEAEKVEAHLFGCDNCSAASDRLGQLVSGLRELIPPVISHAQRDRLAARGKVLVMTPVDAGVDARARFAPGVDLLVHVLRADLSRAERVDVDAVSPDGVPRVRLENVPFDRQAGEVLIACQRHYQHVFSNEFPGDPRFRVYAIEGGERRSVGEYFVLHEWT